MQRKTFWSLLLTGVAVTFVAGFQPSGQTAQAGLFSRLHARMHGYSSCDCYTCAGYVDSCACAYSCAGAPVCAPACAVAPVHACDCPPTCAVYTSDCGCYGGRGYDNDYDDDCDD